MRSFTKKSFGKITRERQTLSNEEKACLEVNYCSFLNMSHNLLDMPVIKFPNVAVSLLRRESKKRGKQSAEIIMLTSVEIEYKIKSCYRRICKI